MTSNIDPLVFNTPDAPRELFNRFVREAGDFDGEHIVIAALNMVVNIVRHSQTRWPEAEATLDEYFGRAKNLLAKNYDHPSGRRKHLPSGKLSAATLTGSIGEDEWLDIQLLGAPL